MARYEFKLPDIGEGIAEAEIVAWHVKVGDTVGEDQQLADMMTDKATVEMESPVAGKVLEVAGEVGDMIAIGSVLVVIETEGEAAAEERAAAGRGAGGADRRRHGRGAGDALEEADAGHRRGDRRAPCRAPKGRQPMPPIRVESAQPQPDGTRCQASPAVRARARDLGIDLASVKYAGDRVRHADLDAYLLYNGGGVSGGPRAEARRTSRSRSSACAARSPRTCRRRSAASRISPWSRNMTSPRSSRRGR